MRRFCLFVIALLIGTILATSVGAQDYRSVRDYHAPIQPTNSGYQSVRHYSFAPQPVSSNRSFETFQETPSQEQSFAGRDPFNESTRRPFIGDELGYDDTPNKGPYYSGTFIDPVPASELSGPTYGSYFTCRCKDEWAGLCKCYTGLGSDSQRCCGKRKTRDGRFASRRGYDAQGGGDCGCR